MATAEQIDALRLLIAELTPATYTDETLSDRLDAVQGNQNLLASVIWREKAALAAELVDVSEGGSSRKLGDIYEQALSMSAHFAGLDNSAAVASSTRVHKLRR